MEKEKRKKNLLKTILLLLFLIALLVTGTFFIIKFVQNTHKINNLKENVTELKDINTKIKRQLDEKLEKIEYLETENKTLKELSEEQLNNLKEAEKKAESLAGELENTQSGLSKRVKLLSDYWLKCGVDASNGTTGFLYFNDLSNVNKMTFSLRYFSMYIGMNDDKMSLPITLDKSQNTGVLNYWLQPIVKRFSENGEIYNEFYHGSPSETFEHIDIEVYYSDGRTENIVTNIGCG